MSWLMMIAPAAAQETVGPLVVSYSMPPTTVDDLLRGGPGEAYFLYYLPDKGPEQPALVVRLSKAARVAEAVAEVFAVPDGQLYVPVTVNEDIPSLPDDLTPAIKIIAFDGWWVRDGLVNYNLDITIYGRIYAMWAADEWPGLIGLQDRNAEIVVRDVNGDGLPDWDWRTMVPEFPNRGYLRTNYAERKCDSPVTIDSGVSPQWPFVAFAGDFLQPTGVFRPPIAVDWLTGQIRYFSELVTVRNQNCSYSFYSLTRVLPGQLNSPNFETPFAFYDLSGNGQGYPDLIIRTGRTILDADAAGLATKQMQVTRYSWSNENVGDGTMDYKVEVFGFHPFKFKTPIADGKALIDAPPYELYPGWVISKLWPAVTFNSVENRAYRTSEGIYEWAPGSLGSNFYLGVVDQGDITAFSDITKGMRGEYRLNTDHQTELYMSPIDNRLHLKWAEHGIWRLD
ncbi:MAG: hypothetical protein H3C69_09400, partial [Candidatus Promineofilum sp.]|nr:hypothetical protein [Promineifilum sp.]